ncbi:AfsR/SARP family transcriptional regulator [Amycolatopsis lurida]
MKFHILGQLTILDNRNERRYITPGKQRDLIALLLLQRNRLVPVGRLVEDLWGFDAPVSAKKNVQTYIWRLRKALNLDEADRLRHEPPGYLIGVHPGELDLDAFDAHADAGHRHFQGGRLREARTELDAALALWQDTPLANTGLNIINCPELAQLEENYVAILELHNDIDLRLGVYADLIAVLRRLTIQYPLRERLRYQLMAALYRSGRHAEALNVYRDISTTMRREFGLEPGRSLGWLHQAILSRSPELDEQTWLRGDPYRPDRLV